MIFVDDLLDDDLLDDLTISSEEAIDREISVKNFDVGYCEKIYVPYTDSRGNENGLVCQPQWLVKIETLVKRSFKFSKRFPFLVVEKQKITHVLLNSGSDIYPKWHHIYALESPKLMSNRLGLKYYPDMAAEIVKDKLENG